MTHRLEARSSTKPRTWQTTAPRWPSHRRAQRRCGASGMISQEALHYMILLCIALGHCLLCYVILHCIIWHEVVSYYTKLN